ncbi:hypothetical protein AJ80_00514 [Polytolypa hystricis UAMH7299]|uniref:Ras-associating domain-containing protein n=1 Tax=Polytolypa hystricis (strain UAMH7299) TaxID=1447883 RepID=A0A2B7Z4H2_POLH7|nr:hypothetical protein AJ80_00514 [Polytolypa hystricis UAMH7299]
MEENPVLAEDHGEVMEAPSPYETSDSPPLADDDLPTATNDLSQKLRVKKHEPTWKLLELTMKRYKLNGKWEDYALYIVYSEGKEEEPLQRRLELSEYPLPLFKRLHAKGKKPRFMLRKNN